MSVFRPTRPQDPARAPGDSTVIDLTGRATHTTEDGEAELGTAQTTITLPSVPVAGAPAPAGIPAVHAAAIAALPPGSALLIVQQGPTTGARFLLAADRTTAGRHPSSDIFLDDVTVSRRHAEFVRRPGGFVLRDVGGLNGTYVARTRIDEVALRSGDEIWIGKYRMTYYAGPPILGS